LLQGLLHFNLGAFVNGEHFMLIPFKRITLTILFFSAMLVAQKRKPQPAASTAPAQPIKLTVDATHAPEKILHAQMEIPVSAGEVKLVFPKWIPGEHGPNRPHH
jgi:hypothetical protein